MHHKLGQFKARLTVLSADTRYEEKLQEKGAQHKALEEALKEYGYNVTTLPIIIGSGS